MVVTLDMPVTDVPGCLTLHTAPQRHQGPTTTVTHPPTLALRNDAVHTLHAGYPCLSVSLPVRLTAFPALTCCPAVTLLLCHPPMLQSASAFMAHSSWASRVGCFINLESIGPGGSPIVFQHSGAWTIQAFAQGAVHPRGAIAAQVGKAWCAAHIFALKQLLVEQCVQRHSVGLCIVLCCLAAVSANTSCRM